MRRNRHVIGAVVLAGLLGGCDAISPETNAPSISYDMAADAGRPFSDRRPAALMLEGLELSKLRGLLMKRIPNGWYTTATNDMFILAVVGDEGTAEYIEQLYTRVPDTREDEASMTVMLHTAVAEIRNRLGTHAFEIAGDPYALSPARVTAALRLSAAERGRMQALLLARVPGKWDVSTANDVGVLAEIGDEAAAQALEAATGYPDTGKLTTRLRSAIDQIRRRMAGGGEEPMPGN